MTPLDTALNDIAALINAAPTPEDRSAMREAVFNRLYNAARYHRWREPGETLTGVLLPRAPSDAFAVLHTPDGDVRFSAGAKDLASKLANIPAGAVVTITYIELVRSHGATRLSTVTMAEGASTAAAR